MIKNDVKVDLQPSSVSVEAASKKSKRQLKKLAAGNTMTKKVMGKEVTFKLVEIKHKDIDRITMVWLDNERDQELLDAHAIEHLIPSFEEHEQQVPAIGREQFGIFEIADGSSRRCAAKITKKSYYAWIGDLSDEQMTYLSEIGNTYKETSAYEKGRKYKRFLKNASQREVAERIGLDRKAMMRYVKTANLPRSFIRSFKSPNDVTARQGEKLHDLYSKLDEARQADVTELCEEWASEKGTYSKEDLIELFTDECVGIKLKPAAAEVTELAMGATLKVKNGKATFNIPSVSDSSLEKIEAFISKTLSEDAVNNC